MVLPRSLQIELLEPLVLMSASTIDGTDAGEWLSGLEGDDVIHAGGGNDEIHDSHGNNVIDGGSGIDTLVVYEGNRADFDLMKARNGDILFSGAGIGGDATSSRLIDVEQIQFNDQIVAAADIETENQSPIANTDLFVAASDTAIRGNVLANDVDADGDSLKVALKTSPASGQLTLLPNGDFQFTPAAGSSGILSFEYSVTDEFGETDTATAHVLVKEASPVIDDADDDLDDPSGKSGSGKSGSAKSGSAKSGSDKSASDKSSKSDSSAGSDKSAASKVPPVVIPQPALNQSPVAAVDSFEGDSGEAIVGNVLANDSDADDDTIFASLLALPENGTVLLNMDGSFSFIPAEDFAGADEFSYRVTDSNGASSDGVVKLNVRPAVVAPVQPNGPVAQDDDFQVIPNETFFGNVSVNDSSSGPALTFELLESPNQGSLNFYSDGSFDYVTDGLTTAADSFTYQVTDSEGNFATAVATITPVAVSPPAPPAVLPPVLPAPGPVLPPTVTPPVEPPVPTPTVPTPPVPEPPATTPPVPWIPPVPATDFAPDADADILSANANQTVTGNLLANDSDADGNALSIVENTSSQFGAVSVDADGAFTYQAEAGFSGIDYFHYVVSDGDQTDRATVVIHVGETRVTPVWSTTEMVVSPIVFDLNNDGVIGVTGESTARTKSPDAEIGRTVQFDIDADGTLDTIEWVDGRGDGILVDTSQIQGTNIDGRALFGDQGGQFENGFEKLALLDTDGNQLLEEGELSRLKLWVDDGDGILKTNELDTLQQHRFFSISTRMNLTSDGLMRSWAYTRDDFRVMTEDVWFAQADQPSADPDNSIPDADPDVFEGKRNTAITGNVLANDSDSDGDRLLVSRSTDPSHGTLTVSDDGNFSYQPDDGFTGVDYFQYEVSDGNGGTDTAVVMLTVLGDSVTAQPGSEVSGLVWHDANLDGLRGASENSRGTSVFVSLLDDTGRILQSTHTDSQGRYEFAGLNSGNYRIQVAASSLPSDQGRSSYFTLQDVNGDFFNQIDSDVNQTAGVSSLFTIADRLEATDYKIDAGFVFV